MTETHSRAQAPGELLTGSHSSHGALSWHPPHTPGHAVCLCDGSHIPVGPSLGESSKSTSWEARSESYHSAHLSHSCCLLTASVIPETPASRTADSTVSESGPCFVTEM